MIRSLNFSSRKDIAMRKVALGTGKMYHVFTKTIAEYKIFNNEKEYQRMVKIINYYKFEDQILKFSKFDIKKEVNNNKFSHKEKNIDIIAYCIMPTHVHLILKQLKDGGISIYMSKVLNSYTRYFNVKHKRKGPLWESRFKNVEIETDEQLLHLTRYIHLNPVTNFMVDDPACWVPSSYNEYTNNIKKDERICNYEGIIDIDPLFYEEFVINRIAYQRELSIIKSHLLE
jgi:putative transposase